MLHLKMHISMRGMTSALEKKRENQELPARPQQLLEELVNLERRAPRIGADYQVKMAILKLGPGVL